MKSKWTRSTVLLIAAFVILICFFLFIETDTTSWALIAAYVVVLRYSYQSLGGLISQLGKLTQFYPYTKDYSIYLGAFDDGRGGRTGIRDADARNESTWFDVRAR